MNTAVLISVIVPAFNLQDYIARTLDSILGQTYPNLEIIVVNDGSSDTTGMVIDHYAQEYPQKVRALHLENGGVTNARMKGVAAARGEWIGFVDGDDVIEADMYARLLENAQKYDADISHCGYQMVFADGRVNYFYNTGFLAQQDHLTALKELLVGSRIEPGLWNKLFHKRLFYNLLHQNVMDTSIRINEDLLMNYYLFSAAKKSVFEDVCKYHYLVRSTSASRKKIDEHRIMDPVRVKKIILDACEEELKNDALRVYLRTCVYSYNSVIWSREYRKQRKMLRDFIKEHRDSFALLPPKQRLMAKMIEKMPWAYGSVYSIYEKFFQKKKYS